MKDQQNNINETDIPLSSNQSSSKSPLRSPTVNNRKSLNNNPPVVTYRYLQNDNRAVKRRTGFSSLEHMLVYAIILCNDDFDKLTATTTVLTWLEEWLFFMNISGDDRYDIRILRHYTKQARNS